MFKIKEARKSRGLTQQQLAERINTTREYISAIENNHKTPSFDLLERIAKELHTSIKNLIEDTA
ncbi:helix-turn-helix domain-containing protein [Clostridium botulinum]|uniref:helix-turn-helix domain-containing protein n=1 Tax=Clostridium botulinum TaxID=1491 RepID=UPI00096C60D9|nr:helix-turn-helix transcriptional regulator [Clostridium botulinum]OSA69855.1 hypothetical protein B2H90_00660 [Clostridium botulinum]OSA82675.1 hypothetical protein B2H84_07650 [Clostridium botulinum]